MVLWLSFFLLVFKLNINVAGTGRSFMFISSLCLRRSVFLVFLLKAVQAPSMPSYLAQGRKKRKKKEDRVSCSSCVCLPEMSLKEMLTDTTRKV